MSDVEIFLDLEPSHSDLDLLVDGLGEHSVSFVDDPGFKPIALFARDSAGSLVGGIYGYQNWTWLHVSLLWVHSGHRSHGLGSILLSRIEAEARDRGCANAHLDTLAYQASEFYRKHGYETFAELQDYPQGQERIFMKKQLLTTESI